MHFGRIEKFGKIRVTDKYKVKMRNQDKIEVEGGGRVSSDNPERSAVDRGIALVERHWLPP